MFQVLKAYLSHAKTLAIATKMLKKCVFKAMRYVFYRKTMFFVPVLSFILKVGRNIVFSINKKAETNGIYFLFQKRIKQKRKINTKTKTTK